MKYILKEIYLYIRRKLGSMIRIRIKESKMDETEQLEFMMRYKGLEILAILGYSKFGSLPTFNKYQFIRICLSENKRQE